ncbi:arylalkylamine N-acetyltransferase 1-like isoform X1 [Vespa crabro]|uniref:arylalkylamine N-acetyltransferase 1-like isoform X1 n=2 Tax=Vespa crabro TaxID=7445 RepID=UPI001F02AD75|nr:arylalkylamine N-acetyltransferase 1-like isoform X1 [Vespa crabro]XP_046824285.1 arylalkylamine N-acetyltransferase 1-like isoform X1 [Vespa crabro]
METILANNLSPTARIGDTNIEQKGKTNFVKDTKKMTRYTLADSADSVINAAMDYHIEIITRDDKHRVLKFLRRFFFRDEPLNQNIALIPEGENSTCLELEDYCSKSSLENNLSLMAVSSTGAIIGVLLNGKLEPCEEDEPDYIENCENLKFRKILRFLHYIDKRVNVGKFQDQNILEIRIISVDTNWRGKGIAKALIEKTIEIAKEHNFQAIRVDCTSMFSGKLCERFGFETIDQVKYSDYVDENGKPIFTPAPPHMAANSYIKRL